MSTADNARPGFIHLDDEEDEELQAALQMSLLESQQGPNYSFGNANQTDDQFDLGFVPDIDTNPGLVNWDNGSQDDERCSSLPQGQEQGHDQNYYMTSEEVNGPGQTEIITFYSSGYDDEDTPATVPDDLDIYSASGEEYTSSVKSEEFCHSLNDQQVRERSGSLSNHDRTAEVVPQWHSFDQQNQNAGGQAAGGEPVMAVQRQSSLRRQSSLERQSSVGASLERQTSVGASLERQTSVGASGVDDERTDSLGLNADELLALHGASNVAAKGDVIDTVSMATKMDAMRIDIQPLMKPFPINSQGFPTNWTDMSEELGEDSAHFKLVELKPTQFEYQKIQEEFFGVGMEVTKVERIQNTVLLDRYTREKEHLKSNRPEGYNLNQRYLFHGTAALKRNICEEGLDARLSRTGHFGRGTYFSDNPVKCVRYCGQATPDNPPYILKCRVLLGDIKEYPPGVADTSLKREPPKEQPRGPWKYYDSVKGCPLNYNEFVIYENRRALVEYFITYKQTDELLRQSQSSNTLVRDIGSASGGAARARRNSLERLTEGGNQRRNSLPEQTSNPEVDSFNAAKQTQDDCNKPKPKPRRIKKKDKDTTQYKRPGRHRKEDEDEESVSETESLEEWGDAQEEEEPDVRPGEEGLTEEEIHEKRLEEVREEVRRKRIEERVRKQVEEEMAKKPSRPIKKYSQEDYLANLKQIRKMLLDNKRKLTLGIPISSTDFGPKDMSAVDKLLDDFNKTYGHLNLGDDDGDAGAAGASGGSTTTTASSTASGGAANTQSDPGDDTSGDTGIDGSDPVQQVLNILVSDFMEITDTTDADMARRFIQQADSDINKALMLYYDQLS